MNDLLEIYSVGVAFCLTSNRNHMTGATHKISLNATNSVADLESGRGEGSQGGPLALFISI